ncbi:glycosyltransferase [Citrobacter sp. S2-9]|uniref:Glycosyltransferase n=1 Tax=Citrobacter enshiensis TaxID=2971264 RepID=A0ABT8PUE5_9ENTR|nr:glycosyltransferase [Citrobacter enshiensis]MDN8599602.1 glycosyltransferase [Citrobacter enshiensis]
MIKISVCVISYNQEDYITECLESIAIQKGDFFLEIVIRDDLSTDSTYERCQNFIDKFSRPNVEFKLLKAAKNLGANKNILEVLNNCTGEFIALCEGDDYWCDENKLKIQLEHASLHQNIDFFVHPAFYLHSDGKLTEEKWPLQEKTVLTQADILKASWQFAPTASYFVRATALKRLPIWFGDATIGDIYIEIYAAENKIASLDKYMSVYRYLSPTSWSMSQSKKSDDVYYKKIKHYQNFIDCLKLVELDYLHLKDNIEYKMAGIKFQLVKLYILTNQKKLAQQVAREMLISQNVISAKKKIFLKLILSSFIFYFTKKFKILLR